MAFAGKTGGASESPATNINSHYQLDSFRDVSESLVGRLKKYLFAALNQIGNLNKLVLESSKTSPFLDLELDSVICRHLFNLKLEVTRAFKKLFEEFDQSLITSITKSFNTNEDEVSKFSLQTLVGPEALTRNNLASFMSASNDHKLEHIRYATFDRFVQDIPSKVRWSNIRLPKNRRRRDFKLEFLYKPISTWKILTDYCYQYSDRRCYRKCNTNEM